MDWRQSPTGSGVAETPPITYRLKRGRVLKNFSATFVRAARWAAMGMMAALLAACASGGGHPPAPLTSATQDYSYIIGPGDSLNIIVWRNPELSMSVPVRPDGNLRGAPQTHLLRPALVKAHVVEDVAERNKFMRRCRSLACLRA